MPRRSWKVYVRPPSLTVGIDTARSGTTCAPAGPPPRRYVTRPSFVKDSTCHGPRIWDGGSGSKRPPNTSFFATIVSVPPRWSRRRPGRSPMFGRPMRPRPVARCRSASKSSTCSELASIRTTEAAGRPPPTHAPFVYATPTGSPPTGICRLWSVAGSMLVTVPSAAFATHTRPRAERDRDRVVPHR